MKVGLVKEIKDRENRVAITPDGAGQLTENGHQVFVETGAGIGSGYTDRDYQIAGGNICTAAQAWDSDLVVKVKEPLESEYPFLGGQTLFTYFHLAGVTPTLTEALLESKTTAIAYETLEDSDGRLPLLAPMSAVAGNMATLVGAYYLARFNGGKGIQLGEVMNKRHGEVLIIGDGVVGRHAAAVATGMGANVIMLGRSKQRAEQIKKEVSSFIDHRISDAGTIAALLPTTDLLVGAVLIPGHHAPHLVSEQMVSTMQPGSVIVDVSIDQGGCIETSRPTSHSEPTYVEHDVIHYCVTNMPGAFPRTSTIALTNATQPYLLRLTDQGVGGLTRNSHEAKAINCHKGYLCNKEVAEAVGHLERFRPLDELLTFDLVN